MKLPVVSGKELLKILEKLGFKPVRQRGSHLTILKETQNGRCLVLIPMMYEIKKKTLLSILRQAKLTRDEFIELWNKR